MRSNRDVLSLVTRDEPVAVVRRSELTLSDRRATDVLVEPAAPSKTAALDDVLLTGEVRVKPTDEAA